MTKRKIDSRDVEIASLRADLDANTRLIAEQLRNIGQLESALKEMHDESDEKQREIWRLSDLIAGAAT